MKYDEYRQIDGTYISPSNNKQYDTLKAFIAHMSYNATGLAYANTARVTCEHCNEEYTIANIKRHTGSCYKNPLNLRECAVCCNPIKDYKGSKGTCSHSCSNTHFAHLRNKPENYTSYRTICFKTHGKECIVCGEDKIVAVHHIDENHENNDPMNLVPLCPTHHQYVHSKYKDEVEPFIIEWQKNNSH